LVKGNIVAAGYDDMIPKRDIHGFERFCNILRQQNVLFDGSGLPPVWLCAKITLVAFSLITSSTIFPNADLRGIQIAP
jgi:hypothetical protein